MFWGTAVNTLPISKRQSPGSFKCWGFDKSLVLSLVLSRSSFKNMFSGLATTPEEIYALVNKISMPSKQPLKQWLLNGEQQFRDEVVGLKLYHHDN